MFSGFRRNLFPGMAKATYPHQWFNAIYRKEWFLNSRPTDTRKSLDPRGGCGAACGSGLLLPAGKSPHLTAEQSLEGFKTSVIILCLLFCNF